MIYEQLSFFQNKIEIEDIIGPRISVLCEMCKDKKVLHIGCADSQYYNEENNLHLHLAKTCKELHGMDIDDKLLIELNKICPGVYFNKLNDIKESYDIILVPEVLEHVLNVNDFLSNIFNIKAKLYFITAPNCQHYCKEMVIENNSSIETIHPDHKYWFSPYTLYKCLEPFIKDRQIRMYYMENKSIVSALISA